MSKGLEIHFIARSREEMQGYINQLKSANGKEAPKARKLAKALERKMQEREAASKV